MKLFLSIEAQNCTENGLSIILRETINKLGFLIDKDTNNYGMEFKLIVIIPSCMDDGFWNALGWKERKCVLRKKGEAEIRLRMDYDRFIKETSQNQHLLFYDIIVKSIQAVQDRSGGDFRGEQLINDILLALNVTKEELMQLNASY